MITATLRDHLNVYGGWYATGDVVEIRDVIPADNTFDTMWSWIRRVDDGPDARWRQVLTVDLIDATRSS